MNMNEILVDWIYKELEKLTKEMLKHGWCWSGAAKLEKGNPFFVMTKHVIFYVKELHEFWCRNTDIVFDFERDEPIQIYEKERKIIDWNSLYTDAFVPGLSAHDIYTIAEILKVGEKLSVLEEMTKNDRYTGLDR